jgi:hypothetical protein
MRKPPTSAAWAELTYKDNPSACPYCGSSALSSVPQFGSRIPSILVECNDCGAAFVAHYTVDNVSTRRPPTKQPKKEVEFTPWVFESGNFQVNVTGEDGGTNIEPDLYPAFDLEDQDGMTDWCVRQKLKGGDSVPVAEVYNGAAQDILTGVRVNRHKMSEADADSMQHEFAGYLAALFAKAPKMQKFILSLQSDDGVPERVRNQSYDLLREIYDAYHNS